MAITQYALEKLQHFTLSAITVNGYGMKKYD